MLSWALRWFYLPVWILVLFSFSIWTDWLPLFTIQQQIHASSGPLHVFPFATFLGGKCCCFHLHALHSLQHVSHQQTKKKVTTSTETPQFGAAIIFHRTALFLDFSQVLFLPRHLTFAVCRTICSLSTFSIPQVLKIEKIWINCVGTPPSFASNTQI